MAPRVGPDRWPLVSPYLDQALDIESEADRASWLASLREREPAIAADVEALLDAHRSLQHDAFLESTISLEPGERSAGANLGAYTLLQPIGRGGMGTVWLAERSDGRFERRVAVKFLHRSLVSGAERFKREGRILARLAHRHIAQLLDAGVSPEGDPYLVLEYVDGEAIDQYCDRHALDVAARLRLFLDVLDAVAHAHASLIVHRDIKPSNVLVARDGCVKLLDFGIAKLLERDDDGSARALLTIEGAAALTPAYAAPEQVTGQPVATAADVYSLGVLLYVLLTGRHPAGEHLHAPADLVKAIVETDPRRPSDAIMLGATDATASEAVATRRGTSRDKLRRALRGDLDTIVSTALKKDPAARYASAAAFADDVRRHLRYEPIAARPDSVAYHSARFIRRHRLAVAAGLTVIASLGIGLYAANRERVIAERRFTQVRQLANRVLALDSEMRGLQGSTKARHQIVSMAKDYLEALRPDAQNDPDLALEIATAYLALALAQGVPTAQNLGLSTQAEESLRTADDLLDSVLARTPKHRMALLQSAKVAQARMIMADTRKQPEEALAFGRHTVTRIDALFEGHSPTPSEADAAVTMLCNVALCYKNAERFTDAIAYARRCVAIVPASARADEQRAQGLSVVADAMRLSGDLDGAFQAIQEARRLIEGAHLDAGSNSVAALYNVLYREGAILGEEGRISLGRPDAAIVVFQRAFDAVEGLAAIDADDGSSRMLFLSVARELGALLRTRDPQRALAMYEQALRRLGEVKDNSRARRGEAALWAGSSYPLRRLGRVAEARQRLDAAFARLQELKLYPAKQVSLGSESDIALRALGDHQAETGDLARGIETYSTLLDKVSAETGANGKNLSNASELSRVYESLWDLYRRAGQPERASEMAQRRMTLWQHWNDKIPGNHFVAAQLGRAKGE